MTEENQTLRIVMLGKTGVGKSSLANTLSGEKGKFKQSASPNSETKACCAETTKINGRNICLVDTPGLFDTDLDSTELSPDILKCIEESAPGPHAFLLVLKVERYTSQEQEVVKTILKYFSTEALKYTTVVFTHGDDLPEGVTIKDWARKNKALKTLIKKCGSRTHVFDNKHWNNSQDPYRNNQYQVRKLLKTIEETQRENNWKYYTNKFLEFVINRMKEMSCCIKYAASVLLGALLGAEEFVKDLYKRYLSVRLSTDEDTSLSQQVQERRIVLLGKTGSGKSSLANTVFGGLAEFNVSHSAGSGTKDSQIKTQTVNGRLMRFIDTPGLCDTDLNNANLTSEQLMSLIECAPGVHTFLLLLKVAKYTMHEREMTKSIFSQFTKEALKYTTVIFTHGDQLPDEITIESWVEENERMKELVKECGGRCHVFDNKYWNNNDHPYRNNQVQIENLLNTIEETVKKNDGRCYTNETLQMLEKEIKQVQINDPKSSLEKTKKIVHKNLWPKLKNVAIGCGFGVFVGAAMIPVGVFLIPCVITGAVVAGVGAATAAASAAVGTATAVTAVASAVVEGLAGHVSKQKKEKEN